MSDQTPPTPDADPTAALPPVAPEIPAADVPAVDVPAAEAPTAPAQWPAEGYPPPPAYPAAPAYAAPDAAAAPPTYPAAPAAYPAGPTPIYASEPIPVYAAPAQTSSNAIISLILAIVSWAVCPIIPAIVALVLASSAAKEIEASGGRIQGAGLVTASRIVSWVNIGLWAAFLVIGAFFLVLAIVAGGMNETNF